MNRVLWRGIERDPDSVADGYALRPPGRKKNCHVNIAQIAQGQAFAARTCCGVRLRIRQDEPGRRMTYRMLRPLVGVLYPKLAPSR